MSSRLHIRLKYWVINSGPSNRRSGLTCCREVHLLEFKPMGNDSVAFRLVRSPQTGGWGPAGGKLKVFYSIRLRVFFYEAFVTYIVVNLHLCNCSEMCQLRWLKAVNVVVHKCKICNQRVFFSIFFFLSPLPLKPKARPWQRSPASVYGTGRRTGGSPEQSAYRSGLHEAFENQTSITFTMTHITH